MTKLKVKVSKAKVIRTLGEKAKYSFANAYLREGKISAYLDGVRDCFEQLEDSLNKLDHKESSLVYIGRDANGNKRYTTNSPQKKRS